MLNQLKLLDVNVNINWPLVHYRTAVHYLSKGTGEEKGTGGTNWQKYLPPRFQKESLSRVVVKERIQEWGKLVDSFELSYFIGLI